VALPNPHPRSLCECLRSRFILPASMKRRVPFVEALMLTNAIELTQIIYLAILEEIWAGIGQEFASPRHRRLDLHFRGSGKVSRVAELTKVITEQ
jgi:hypothetical protein